MASRESLLSGPGAVPSKAPPGSRGLSLVAIVSGLLTGFACALVLTWPHGVQNDLPAVQLPAMNVARAPIPMFPKLGLAPGRAQHGLALAPPGRERGLDRKSLRTLPIAAAAPVLDEMETRTGWGKGDWSTFFERQRVGQSRQPEVGDEVYNKQWVFASGDWELAADAVATVVEVNPEVVNTLAGKQFKLKNPAGQVSNWLYIKDYWYNSPERMAKLKAEAEAAAAAEAAKKAAAEKKAQQAAAKKKDE